MSESPPLGTHPQSSKSTYLCANEAQLQTAPPCPLRLSLPPKWCVGISTTGPVWSERDWGGGQGWPPHGSVQDSLDCRIESAVVAIASEEHILLAQAHALLAPTGSLPGLPGAASWPGFGLGSTEALSAVSDE